MSGIIADKPGARWRARIARLNQGGYTPELGPATNNSTGAAMDQIKPYPGNLPQAIQTASQNANIW